MTLKDWFETRKEQQQAARPVNAEIDDNIGKLWVKCFNCNSQLPRKELEQQMMVCPQCGYHFRINARTRIKQLFDEGTFEEYFENISPSDPLEFFDTEAYKDSTTAAPAISRESHTGDPSAKSTICQVRHLLPGIFSVSGCVVSSRIFSRQPTARTASSSERPSSIRSSIISL